MARPRRAGRPPLLRADLEKVAKLYSEAYYAGKPPVQAVAKALGCDAKTAARRIGQSPKRGVLLTTAQGVPGGIPIVMPRGTARSLRALVENEKRREMVREGQAAAAAKVDPDSDGDGQGEP